MNCPNCGLKEFVDNQRAILIDVLKTVTGKPVYYCECSEEQKEQAKKEYWKANKISKKQAEKLQDLDFQVWWLHNQPNMGDCRSLDYGYRVSGDQIICEACGDFINITEEVIERFKSEYKGGF